MPAAKDYWDRFLECHQHPKIFKEVHHLKQRSCSESVETKSAEGLAFVKNDQNYSFSFWRSIILPSDAVTRTCWALTFKVFDGLCSSVTSPKSTCLKGLQKNHDASCHGSRCISVRNTSAKHVVRPSGVTHFSQVSLKSPQRTTGSPPPCKVPPQSNAGGQKVVSKVKFAPPPFCLFVAMTPWCG